MIVEGSIEGCGDLEESDRVTSSRDRTVCRRTILRAGPTVVAAGVLAGCLGDDGDSNDDHTTSSTEGTDNDDNGNNGEEEVPEIEYELEFTATDIDLTELNTSILEEYDQERILEEGLTTELEYEIRKYEDDEEAELTEDEIGHVTLQYENADGENVEIDLLEELENDVYEIATNEITDGTRITLEAEIDGETQTQRETVNKETPRSHQLQGIIDGQTITPYETIFQFDNEDRIETQQQKRQQAVEQIKDSDAYQEAEQNITEEELQEIYEDPGLTEEEKKQEITSKVSEQARNSFGNFSGEALNQARAIENIIQEKTPYEQVKFSNVLNPADQTSDTKGNHGSIYGVINNHHMHVETIMDEVTEFGYTGTLMGNGSLSDFVAVHAEFHEGDMEELTDSLKTKRMSRFYLSHSVPGGGLKSYKLTVSDKFGSTGLEMLRDQADRDEVMKAVDLAAAHHLETGNHVEIEGTPQQPELHVN